MRTMAIRLTMAFMCIIAFLIIQGVVGYFNALKLSEVHREALSGELKIVMLLEKLARNRLTVFKIVGTMNPGLMDKLKQDYLDEIEFISPALQKRDIPTGLIQKNQRLYDEIIRLHYNFSVKTARALLNTKSKEVHEAIVQRLSEQTRIVEEMTQRQIQKAYIESILITACLLVAALVTAIAWAVALMRSLTDRKIAETNLKESEEKYRLIFDLSKDAIVITTYEGRVIDCNQATMDLFNVESKEELSVLRATDFWIDKNIRSQFMERLKKDGYIAQHETALKRKNGETITTVGSSAVIETRKGAFIVNVLHDITQRKKVEEALRKSEERLRAIFAAAQNISFIITNADAQNPIVIEFSPGAENIFGFTRDEMIGRPVAVLHIPEDVEKFPEATQKMADGGKGFSGETTLIRKSGEKFPALFTTYPLYDEKGEMYAALGVSFDISEQRKLEAQLQQSHKMEAVGTLAGGIAHDFNNIIGIILGNTELALDDVPESHPIHKKLETIKTVCLRAKDVVKQLLSFSRKTEAEKTPIRVASLISESLHFLRSTIPSNIGFDIDLSAESEKVMAVPSQINQIMINLCTNAAHAMEETGGVISIRLAGKVLNQQDIHNLDPILSPGKYIILTVSDTGTGIPQKDIHRIFEPYYTTKTIGKGTGMGLAVVHGIIRSLNGSISVESKIGKGTSFQLYLPVTEQDSDTEIETIENPAPGMGRILLVDDEEMLVELGKELLEKLGYTVQTSTNPMEALEIFRNDRYGFDAVITDMTMPNMTGDVFSENILKIRADIPIILCTGFSQKISDEKAKAIGIRRYVEKPIKIHEIARILKDIIPKK